MPNLIENILYLEFSDFPEECWNYLKRVCNGNRRYEMLSYRNIPDPEDGRKRLIEYDSIPNKTLEKYQIPPKELLIEQWNCRELKKEIRIDTEDMKYYLQNQHTSMQAQEYARLAAWCRFLAGQTNRYAKLRGYSSLEQLTETAIQVMKVDVKVRKIENWRVFRRLINPFKGAKKGTDVYRSALENLINKHNTTRTSYKRNDISDRIIVSLYMNLSSDVKIPDKYIWNAYNNIAQGKKIALDPDTAEIISTHTDTLELLSIQTIRNTITPAVQAFADKYRHGTKYQNDRHRPYVHGKRPNYAFSLSTSDGQATPFRLKINGKETFTRPVAYLIFDTASEAIIGMSIGIVESKELMRNSFADMLRFTDGVCPLENQLDNFGRSLKPELENIFPVLTFCEPFNPQGKYAENFIGRFEQEQCRFREGWLGGNIQDKKQNQKRNEDKPARAYTLDEIVNMYDEMRREWNNTVPDWNKKETTRLEMLANRNPDAIILPDHSLVWWTGEVRRDKISRNTVDVDYYGEELTYYIPDYTTVLESLTSWTVRVRFLPKSMHERAWIYRIKDKDKPELDTLICEVLAMQYTQRAKAEQTPQDREILARIEKEKREFDNWTERRKSQYTPIQVVNTEMTIDEAEAVLADGYSDKRLMQQAEEVLTQPEPKKIYTRW